MFDEKEEFEVDNDLCAVSFIKLSHHITQIPNKNERMFLNILLHMSFMIE